MSTPKLPDAGPLDMTERTIVLQQGKPRSAALAQILAPHEARLTAIEKALGLQAQRDVAQDRALAAETTARAQGDAAEATTRGATDTAQAARLTTMEGRPEEAVHFTATAALPAITALNPVTLTLTNLVAAKAGDVLKAGESVQVQPATALPAGANIAAARVPADGQVAIQLTTGIAIALQATPTVWNITALR